MNNTNDVAKLSNINKDKAVSNMNKYVSKLENMMVNLPGYFSVGKRNVKYIRQFLTDYCKFLEKKFVYKTEEGTKFVNIELDTDYIHLYLSLSSLVKRLDSKVMTTKFYNGLFENLKYVNNNKIVTMIKIYRTKFNSLPIKDLISFVESNCNYKLTFNDKQSLLKIPDLSEEDVTAIVEGLSKEEFVNLIKNNNLNEKIISLNLNRIFQNQELLNYLISENKLNSKECHDLLTVVMANNDLKPEQKLDLFIKLIDKLPAMEYQDICEQFVKSCENNNACLNACNNIISDGVFSDSQKLTTLREGKLLEILMLHSDILDNLKCGDCKTLSNNINAFLEAFPNSYYKSTILSSIILPQLEKNVVNRNLKNCYDIAELIKENEFNTDEIFELLNDNNANDFIKIFNSVLSDEDPADKKADTNEQELAFGAC